MMIDTDKEPFYSLIQSMIKTNYDTIKNNILLKFINKIVSTPYVHFFAYDSNPNDFIGRLFLSAFVMDRTRDKLHFTELLKDLDNEGLNVSCTYNTHDIEIVRVNIKPDFVVEFERKRILGEVFAALDLNNTLLFPMNIGRLDDYKTPYPECNYKTIVELVNDTLREFNVYITAYPFSRNSATLYLKKV